MKAAPAWMRRSRRAQEVLAPMHDDPNTERWRPVHGWEDIYSVSDRGRVRRELSARGAIAGALLKPVCGRSAYPSVALRRLGVHVRKSVHVLVLEAFVGPRPEGLVSNHKDGDKANSNLENLEWVSVSENNAHAYRTGLKSWSPKSAAGKRARTHCKHGHAFKDNAYYRKGDGARICKTCHKERQKA